MDIRVERFPTLRVASYWAFGPSPQDEAIAQVRAWAEAHGVNGTARFFGFANPDPCGPEDRSGFEAWVSLGAGTAGGQPTQPGIRVKDVPPGLFAVATVPCDQQQSGFAAIGSWVNAQTSYSHGLHQGFVEYLYEAGAMPAALRLYHPITETRLPMAPQIVELPPMAVLCRRLSGLTEALAWYHAFVNHHRHDGLLERLRVIQAPDDPAYEIWILSTSDAFAGDGLTARTFAGGRFARFMTSVLRVPRDIGHCADLMAQHGLQHGRGPFLLEPFRHLDDLSQRHAIALYYPVR